ncbi:MAG: HAMP domain-containing histidine kinase [Nitrospirae bacterium YQR-1]
MKAEFLALLAIFGGIVIIAVLIYLKFIGNRVFKTCIDVIHLNEKLNYNPLQFIKDVRNYFDDLNITDYSYNIVFVGSIASFDPLLEDEPISKHYKDDDCTIILRTFPRYRSGEYRLINRIVIEVLFLLLKSDILMKIKMMNETFANIAKIHTFIQHDIKNIAQFIQNCSYNLQSLNSTEEEIRYVKYLKETFEPLLLKATRIINIIDFKQYSDKPRMVNLRGIIEKITSLYKLRCKINGDAQVVFDESRLFLIFDNLLKNIYDKSLVEEITCTIDIKVDDTQVVVSVFDSGSPIFEISKVFEAFYSSKEGGSGLGLFQVKDMLGQIGGTIEAQNLEKGVKFQLTIPQLTAMP